LGGFFCPAAPWPGDGVAELCWRPGAVPACERDPGALDEEPRRVGCEWLAFECALEFFDGLVVVAGGAVVAGVDPAAGAGVPVVV
jgi:hypothetical protein